MSKKRSTKKNYTKKSNNKRNYKYIDNNFSVILLGILMLIIVSLLMNNLYMKKIIKLLNNKIETKEVVQKDKIIFLGDSITYGYDIQKYYDDKNLINKGINGDTTEGILNRLQESVYDYNVKKVILLIGTNDINRQIDPTNNIELIINKIKNYDSDIEILIQSIYPINNTKNSKINNAVVNNRTNEQIKKINQKIKSICSQKNITYVNIYDELIDKDGNLKIEYTKEGLHLNEEGYKKVTNILNKYINK